ncbi:MAG TPA: alcohol dehydrogenase catalytic domain-containing protein, partial [Candidatus Acidoferrales bacterium]
MSTAHTAQMKALRKMRPGPGAAVDSVPVPAIGPGDALVRVHTASICGTDLHIYQWNPWSASRIRPPMTFGHEFCGTVERVGSEVTGIAVGDFVSAEMHIACGRCRQCRVGQAHVCQHLSILGIDQDGCFAEFIRIPAGNIWKIDPAIPEHYGAILDALGNAVHAVLSGEIAGQTVAVTGCGPIGLMSIAVAKACGAAAIFATEVNPQRRAMALTMGAAEALDPSAGDAAARVR